MVARDDSADGVDLAKDKVGTGVVGFLGGVFHVSIVMYTDQDGGWVF